MQTNLYIQAGYTHMIHYSEMHPKLGKVVKSFPTTTDAVMQSINRLHTNGFADAYWVVL
jgi:hypothetical protein